MDTKERYSEDVKVNFYHVIIAFSKYFVFKLARAIFCFVQQQIWWPISGTNKELKTMANRNDHGEPTAQVLDIIYRYKLEPALGGDVTDFILFHRHFTTLDIIKQDNVTLYAIDQDKATFVETDEKVTPWKSQHGSFFTEAQYNHARRVIIVYKKSFDFLSSQLSFSTRNLQLVLISNVTRCGGSLLTQVFDHTNYCVTFNEPNVIDTISAAWLTSTSPEVDKLAVYAVNFLCKPVQKPSKVLAYVIKARPNPGTAKNFHRLFGQSCKQMLMYRSLLDIAPSLSKLKYKTPFLRLVMTMSESSIFTKTSDAISRKLTSNGYVPHFNVKHPYSVGIRLWFTAILEYLELRKINVDIVAVRYEDLIGDKEGSVRAIFRHCEIPEEYVFSSLKAFEKDAQEMSPISRRALSHISVPPFPDSLINFCNNLCEKYNLPLVNGECRIEGTITSKLRAKIFPIKPKANARQFVLRSD